MKLKEYIPLYFELHVNVDNRAHVAYMKKLVVEREFLPTLGDREMDTIHTVDIRRLIVGWTKRGLKSKTMNNYLSVLRNLLGCAVVDDLLKVACVIETRKKVQEPETRALNPAQIAQVIEAVKQEEDPVWEIAVRLALLTGMRVGELRALSTDAIRTDNGKPVLWIGRSTSGRFRVIGESKGRPRLLPLRPDIAAVIERALGKPIVEQGHGRVQLIIQRVELRDRGLPLTYKAFECVIKKVRSRIGLPWLHWHTFRHTFATQLRNRGIPMAHIQALLGHVDLRTTSRYAHIVSSELYAATAVLDSWLPE